MFQQQTRLDPSTGSESNERGVRPDRFSDFGSVKMQELRLCAGDVILGQLADLLEQVRAALVVEKFAGQRWGRDAQSRNNFSKKICTDRLEIEDRNATGSSAH